MNLIRVVIESPYAGDVEENIKYARRCIKDSISRGEAPIASHLLYTQEGLLDDDTAREERDLGLRMGLEWVHVAKKHVFYIDKGVSAGMLKAIAFAESHGYSIEYRLIDV